MKLAVFDFDSTLMDGETIDEFAKALGLQDKVASLTAKAMAGEIDFFESLIMRVQLLKGLKEEEIIKIAHNLPFMPGAKETISQLKKLGYTVVCFSGGFRVATSYAKEQLGFDADFANILHAKDGILTGLVGGDMMFNYSKGDMLQRLQHILGISKEDTFVCGDGANDLSMFEYADTRVAFCAKDVLKKAANVIIDKKDLKEVLNYVY
ncbi:MAG: phosphoserine phosphatase SerB [Epsilonproteobacteria bacterium]|nr:phosphoserine phosphatase SerB [Campylobacterota bacterium]